MFLPKIKGAMLLLSFLLLVKTNAQTPDPPVITINGNSYNVNFTSCEQIAPVSICFTSMASYEGAADLIERFEYDIRILRNGVVVTQTVLESGDPQIACGPPCPDITHCFSSVEPLSGTYYATIEIRRYTFGVFQSIMYTGISNSIQITRPDDGLFATCIGNDYLNSGSFCPPNDMSIYNFVPGEVLVVQKNAGIIYKFSGLGTTGLNMWRMNFGPPSNITPFNYLRGYQDFDTPITDIVYTPDGKTVISFVDGKVLKINGSGGTGSNMFGVSESPTAFAGLINPSTGLPYPYYMGHTKFLSAVTDLADINGFLFISCSNGNMLKINGSGGGGGNMFAVTETPTQFYNLTNPATGLPYPYYSGHAHFLGSALEVTQAGSQTFVTFNNGKILKINGAGGTGGNMFAVTETATDFTNLINPSTGLPYPYYVGHGKYDGVAVNIFYNGTHSFISFSNGKILKINGTGGTAGNMFAVTETPSDFFNIINPSTGLPYPYYSGHTKYSSAVTSISQNSAANKLFIGFANGKMMKVTGSGGTGGNMFNATETALGFTTSGPTTPYLEGSSLFNSAVTDIKFFGTQHVICLANNKVLKINGNGGTGYNMYAVSQSFQGFRPLLGFTQYLTGSMSFISCATSGSRELVSAMPENLKKSGHETCIKAYPNPFDTHLTIELSGSSNDCKTTIEIFDISGRKVISEDLSGQAPIDINTSDIDKGIYLVKVRQQNGTVTTKKIIKQ